MTSFLDRLMGRSDPPGLPTLKASTGGGWLAAYQQGGVNISSLSADPQEKAARLLQAYKVGWFYKAESKISMDIAMLKRSLAPEDDSGDNETDILEADLTAPFRSLSPELQFLRLMERPNPSQTGRQLFQKTQIRLDMAGWTYWYLENAGPVGSGLLPTAIYGISPARLKPAFDKSGRLIGWVMDSKGQGTGIPFETYEIVQFSQETAEDVTYGGQGVVEAVIGELPLSSQYAQHQSDLLSTGGRLAGMMWPKDRALEENEFDDAKRAWRSVASDPNAARRLLLFPEPMEYNQGAASPKDIGIPELADLNRDNILTAFPISPYILGVPTPGGLNSGETRREDRRDYWEGTIHPRVELLEEVIQTNIVALYEAVTGTTYDFDIAEPDMDDAASLIEKVAAFEALVAAGFKPEDAIDTLDLDDMEWTKPEPPPPPVLPTVTDTTAAPPSVTQTVSQPTPPPAKAVKSATHERDAVTDPATTRAKARLEAFFADQKGRTVQNLRTLLPQTKAGRMKAEPPTWWDPEFEDEQLTSTMRAIYAEVGRGGLQVVADNIGRVIFKGATQAVIADLLNYGGERVKDINARTLQALTVELAEGTRRGYSIPQLIDGVPDEGYKGVLASGLDNGVPVWSDLRAETIARTETMLSYNRATITGYGEFGVTHLLAYDGDDDLECETRNGNEYTIDEALAEEDHPNGTLVWSPVVDKAAHVEHQTVPIDFAMKALELAARTGEVPTFNIHPANAPDVHIDGATINVDAPIVNVEPAAVTFIPPETVINVDAPIITLEAAKAPDVHMDAPIVNVTPTFESPVINVDAPIVTVEAAKAPDVYVTTPDVHIDPVTVTVEAAPPTKVTKTIKRNAKGEITHIEES